MAVQTVSVKQARRAAISAQLLDGRGRLPRSKAGVEQLISRLGYVQIDTINVIERAPHHTIWNRIPRYRQDWLHQLQAEDRTVFEYWGHGASYLPLSDYRWYLPLMKRYREEPFAWADYQRKKNGDAMKEVLARIRDEGPLGAKDFETPKGSTSPWWGWKPAKAALELLFWQGDLMIAERRGFPPRGAHLTEGDLIGPQKRRLFFLSATKRAAVPPRTSASGCVA